MTKLFLGFLGAFLLFGCFVYGITTHSVLLTWDPVTGATSYTVYRGTVSGGPWGTIACTTTTATTCTDASVTNGTTYYYVATATNASGESGPSIQATAVIPQPPGTPQNLKAVVQ